MDHAVDPDLCPRSWACGPTITSAAIVVGWFSRPRTSACSITMLRAPMETDPASAVTTAPKRILLS